jgi:hypothetical protein
MHLYILYHSFDQQAMSDVDISFCFYVTWPIFVVTQCIEFVGKCERRVTLSE